MKPNAPLAADQLVEVARLFQVLAEPTRLGILQELKGGAKSVSALVAALRARQANVSKQLGILHGAGLLDRTPDGGMVYYAIREPVIFELCGLVCDKLRRDAERQSALFRAGRK
jgi:DNA-binding transcriptional ArsR family regulator